MKMEDGRGKREVERRNHREVSSAEEGWRGCGACLRCERPLIGGGPIMGLFSCLGLIIGFRENIDLLVGYGMVRGW
jgi:hypothetical protein